MKDKNHYDFVNNPSHFNNKLLYIYNKEYWNKSDYIIYNALNIDESESLFVGSNRNKFRIFYNYLLNKKNKLY